MRSLKFIKTNRNYKVEVSYSDKYNPVVKLLEYKVCAMHIDLPSKCTSHHEQLNSTTSADSREVMSVAARCGSTNTNAEPDVFSPHNFALMVAAEKNSNPGHPDFYIRIRKTKEQEVNLTQFNDFVEYIESNIKELHLVASVNIGCSTGHIHIDVNLLFIIFPCLKSLDLESCVLECPIIVPNKFTQELYIYSCSGFKSVYLTRDMTNLSLWYVDSVISIGPKMHDKFNSLFVHNCDKFRLMPKQPYPESFTRLDINNVPEMHLDIPATISRLTIGCEIKSVSKLDRPLKTLTLTSYPLNLMRENILLNIMPGDTAFENWHATPMLISIYISSIGSSVNYPVIFMYECVINILMSRIILHSELSRNKYKDHSITEYIQQKIISTPDHIAEYVFANCCYNSMLFWNDKITLYDCLLHACIYYVETRPIARICKTPIRIGTQAKLREYLVIGFLAPFKKHIDALQKYNKEQFSQFCSIMSGKVIAKALIC